MRSLSRTHTHTSVHTRIQRNAEGMLKNMAIHELALAATFFNMTADGMDKVTVNKDNSECLTLSDKTDFVKVDCVCKRVCCVYACVCMCACMHVFVR